MGAGFLALGVVLMASMLFSVRQQGDDAPLRHSLEVEVNLNGVLSALQHAEIGQRGYLLAGDENCLEPYCTSTTEIGRRLGLLEASVQDNPVPPSAFAELRTLVEQKRAELAQSLGSSRAATRPERWRSFAAGAALSSWTASAR